MGKLSFAFLGTTNYSKELLLFLINKQLIPKVIFSIPEEFNISYSNTKVKNSNYSNLNPIANTHNIQYIEIDSSHGKRLQDYNADIKAMNLDLLLVLGWYYMIPKSTRSLTKYGSWGIHASLLPKYAGGAPLNWAIINGEKETGVTLFRMEDGVDDGDIIVQKSFSIEYTDSIKEVYEKAILASKEVLESVLKNPENVKFTTQKKNEIRVYPQRNPEDGEIDLNKPSFELYNFIRAQSFPYPGAFIRTSDGKKLIIEKARVE
jgi:methionyl-tRNA formyltransferase